MGVAVNIEPAAGKQIAAAEKINHKQPTYYNPVSIVRLLPSLAFLTRIC